MKKRLALITAATAAATIAYRAIKGYGVFNKYRFANEHKAIGDYLSANHPNAFYGPIAQTGESVSTIVTDASHRFLLILTKSADGIYIFSEKELDHK